MSTLYSKIITPEPGETLAFHVYAPAMRYRLDHPELELPVMALRSSRSGFKWMRLFHRIEGSSFRMQELFGNPLPGTGRSGVAIPFTDEGVQVLYNPDVRECSFFTGEGCTSDQTLQAIIRQYAATRRPAPAARD